MHKPVLILKIGSAAITNKDGLVNEAAIDSIASQLSVIHEKYRLVVVSSGAVATGKSFMKNWTGSITERKAAAAVGNPILISLYRKAFEPYGIAIAQTLCERQHFSGRSSFLQLRHTLTELWKNGMIPIANENDVVSSLELKFSDNDELATLLAAGFDAECMLMASSAGGLRKADGSVVPVIEEIDDAVMGLASPEKSASGLGGMVSKLTFARLATRMGIRVVVFDLLQENSIHQALNGHTGTTFQARKSTATLRQKWLASGSLVSGILIVDPGAVKALLNRKSLLAVGVLKVEGSFRKGEIVEVRNPESQTIAVGRSSCNSEELSILPGKKGIEVCHADELVIL
jgi:glutamate 5-kinase